MTPLLPWSVNGRQLLVLGLLLLPVALLTWTWSGLPAQVPVHFTRSGADQYADKQLCWVLVWVPLLVYGAARWLSPSPTTPPDAASRRLLTGGMVLLSVLLCVWLVAVSHGAG